MKPRINYVKAAPGVRDALLKLSAYAAQSGLDESLLGLVVLRASQISVDMRWKDLKALGESEGRLYVLDAWRESTLYNARERGALEWTKAVTLVADTHVPDSVYETARNLLPDSRGPLSTVLQCPAGGSRAHRVTGSSTVFARRMSGSKGRK